MPEISRFLGIVIGVFYNEHGVPHFHAVYGEFDTTVEIESEHVHGHLPGGRSVWSLNGPASIAQNYWTYVFDGRACGACHQRERAIPARTYRSKPGRTVLAYRHRPGTRRSHRRCSGVHVRHRVHPQGVRQRRINVRNSELPSRLRDGQSIDTTHFREKNGLAR